MKDFFKNEKTAFITLILAISFACIWGQYTKPQLPDVQKDEWIYDGAEVLSEETESLLKIYNSNWDEYQSICAVAALESIGTWDVEKFAIALGGKWKLGYNDLVLILNEENDEWYIDGGSMIMGMLSAEQRERIDQAVSAPLTDGGYEAKFKNIFTTLNGIIPVIFQTQGEEYGEQLEAFVQSGYMDPGWQNYDRAPTESFVLLLLALLLIWVLIDYTRYARYRRRYMGPRRPDVVPPYRPIFFGHYEDGLRNPFKRL